MKRSVAYWIDKFWGRSLFIFLIIAIAAITGCVNYEAATRHLNYGIAYIETGQYTPALKELMEADKNNPRDPKIHYYLGICYYGKGLTKEAASEFKRAVDLKPDYSEAHNYLGLIYTESGRFEDAIAEFRAALANLLYETPSFAMSNLGWAYYKKGDYNAALGQYQEILNRDPNTSILPIVERNIGIVLVAQGKYSQALNHLSKSLELAPQFAAEQTHYWMGKALAGQGKTKDAESEYKKAIEFAPNSKYAVDSAAELEKLNAKPAPPAAPLAVSKPEPPARVAPEPAVAPKKTAEAKPALPPVIQPVIQEDKKAPVKAEEPQKSGSPEAAPSVHVVKKGETLYSIARVYGLPVQTLGDANKMSTKYHVKTGERLVIPSTSRKEAGVKAGSESLARIIQYQVKPGDSLSSVAKKFHTTMAGIKQLNNLKKNTLDKGQVLKIRTSR